MSIDYDVILAVGKEFDDGYEALQFLLDNLECADDSEQSEADCVEIVAPDGLDFGSFNYMTGRGYYIGFNFGTPNTLTFQKSYDSALAKWRKLFPGQVAEVVLTVQVS